MKKQEREAAEKYLLQRIFEEDPDFVDKTMEAYGVSRSTVYNYINTLQNNGELERVGGSMPYRIQYQTSRFTIDPTRDRSEDRIFNRDVAPLLEELPQNVQKIWRYAVTAMLNNALEHARASAVICVVSRSRLSTIVGVLDNGVGIFRRIQQDYKETTGEILSVPEAASLLYPGGYSGKPDTHSGEGIFFASRLMDHFAIRSDFQLFTPFEADAEEEGGERFRGTAVQMALSNDSAKELSAVMERYITPEDGFCRTEIPVLRFFSGEAPMSRSEARRLGAVLTDFKVAELNFTGVDEIGPDFAHELFAVFARQTPTLTLECTNTSPKVEAILRRVR